ncbi:MAG: hypothetical protein KBS95_07375 [Alistipes sp.]|nr:hypothetical protein [Candidatus Alistipes equi]
MEKQTFTTNFWVSPSKTIKNGEAPIMTTLTLNGERASFSTHKSITTKNWDIVKQKLRVELTHTKLLVFRFSPRLYLLSNLLQIIIGNFYFLYACVFQCTTEAYLVYHSLITNIVNLPLRQYFPYFMNGFIEQPGTLSSSYKVKF